MIKYVFVFVLLCAPVWAGPACREDIVRLRGENTQAQFKVEIAETPQTQAQGLMHRETLARFGGMLFIFEAPKTANFWMRNTLIYLDLLFFDRSGTLKHIHHNAIPLDETTIHGGDDIQYVLEINGGLAKALGFAPGMIMQHPKIETQYAKWPC